MASLVLEDVVAGYGELTVLNGTSLQAARGAITTIIGPNGAGKSTVFKTVFGLLPARAGRVLFAALVACGAASVQFLMYRTNGLLWSLVVFSLAVPLMLLYELSIWSVKMVEAKAKPQPAAGEAKPEGSPAE